MKQLMSYSGREFSYSDTGSHRDSKKVVANDEQKAILQEIIGCSHERFSDQEYNVHTLWHSCPDYDGKIGGYAYSSLVEEWAKDKPWVTSFRFDDEMFMGSVGFIIPSMSKYERMGLNILLIPQGGDPFNFFCYESHLKSLLAAFTKSSEIFLSVDERDKTSPLFFKREALVEKLLNSI